MPEPTIVHCPEAGVGYEQGADVGGGVGDAGVGGGAGVGCTHFSYTQLPEDEGLRSEGVLIALVGHSFISPWSSQPWSYTPQQVGIAEHADCASSTDE